ncbi:MAG TPA: GAF domain-containing protein, partial [Anaerolineales bacterium]|nr:GAF domain-containing protein [Anaerolineales bacterium]
MVRPAADIQTIQRQFQDVHTLLMNVMDALSRNGNPIVSAAIQDVTRVSEKVRKLELGVNEHARVRQSQLGALMGIGRVINSSRGLQGVLEEVMDTLIALMRAERGFLMLRDPRDGMLQPRISRGIDHLNLDAEITKVSQTIVRKVSSTGESVLTTNAQADPRFENQMSVATYQLRSILCAPLKLRNEMIGVIYVDNRAHTGIFRESDLE